MQVLGNLRRDLGVGRRDAIAVGAMARDAYLAGDLLRLLDILRLDAADDED